MTVAYYVQRDRNIIIRKYEIDEILGEGEKERCKLINEGAERNNLRIYSLILSLIHSWWGTFERGQPT